MKRQIDRSGASFYTDDGEMHLFRRPGDLRDDEVFARFDI
jgi:hypothetical protein